MKRRKPTIGTDPLTLYYVVVTKHETSDLDIFVTAHTPEEAFTLWRLHQVGNIPEDYEQYADVEVVIYHIPFEAHARAVAKNRVGVHTWVPANTFPGNHRSLVTAAIEASVTTSPQPLP